MDVDVQISQDSDSDSSSSSSSSSSSYSFSAGRSSAAPRPTSTAEPSLARPTRADSPEPVYDDEAILRGIIEDSIRADYTPGHLTLLPAPASSLPRPLSPDFLATVERRRVADEKREEEAKARAEVEALGKGKEMGGGRRGESEAEAASRKARFEHLRRPAVEDSEDWMRLFTESFGDELDSLRRVSTARASLPQVPNMRLTETTSSVRPSCRESRTSHCLVRTPVYLCSSTPYPLDPNLSISERRRLQISAHFTRYTPPPCTILSRPFETLHLLIHKVPTMSPDSCVRLC